MQRRRGGFSSPDDVPASLSTNRNSDKANYAVRAFDGEVSSLSKFGRAVCASSPFAVGSMEIKLAKGTLRVAGNVDAVVLRSAIECLVE
jgi:hypothetical protein